MERFAPPTGEFGYFPSHLMEFTVTGERLDVQRPEGILAGDEPAVKRISADGPEYTSSQIVEFLFLCAPILIPPTLFALCSSFGALGIDEAEAQLIELQLGLAQNFGQEKFGDLSIADWKRELGERIPFRLGAEPGEDRSVYKFKQFLQACWKAFCADGQLVIDG